MNPLTAAKLNIVGRGLVGFLLMFGGFAISRGTGAVVGFPLAVIGAVRAMTEFGRYMRLVELQRGGGVGTGTHYQESRRGGLRTESVGEVMARLLFTIAELDGPAGAAERVAAIRIIVEQFPDPRLVQAVQDWKFEKLDEPTIRSVLRQIRAAASEEDRMRVFRWCARVALSDQRFNSDEHAMLQLVANELGIRPEVARHLFHDVKGRILAERTARSDGGESNSSSRGSFAVGRRAEALATLDLPSDAGEDAIRRRHRELVKQLHPDANRNRSPVEIAAATERFRRIQKAYEFLTESK